MTEKPKRGGQVPPPPEGDEWNLRYGTKEALGFEELAKQYPGNCAEAIQRLKTAPTTRSDVQKRLKGRLGSRTLRGVEMEQWQIDIARGARLWYCVDPEEKTVWLTLAATGHPRATDVKGGKGPRNR